MVGAKTLRGCVYGSTDPAPRLSRDRAPPAGGQARPRRAGHAPHRARRAERRVPRHAGGRGRPQHHRLLTPTWSDDPSDDTRPSTPAAVPGCRCLSRVRSLLDVIKYLGSKRRLVPVLGAIATVAGARTRARPVHRDDACRAGAQAARRARHRGRHRPLRRGVRAVLRRDSTATPSTSPRSRTRSPISMARPGRRRLLHRDVLRAVALLPARQRPAHRRHPRRDRARLPRAPGCTRCC